MLLLPNVAYKRLFVDYAMIIMGMFGSCIYLIMLVGGSDQDSVLVFDNHDTHCTYLSSN